MVTGIVQKVEFNVPKAGKSGPYTVHVLEWYLESGEHRTDNIFPNKPEAVVVMTLAAGDKIEAELVQSGTFKNIANIKLLEKGNGVAPPPPAAKPWAGKGGGFGGKDPEVQAAIIRQNALTNAVHFITSDGVMAIVAPKGAIPTVDFLGDLVLNIARKFEGYTSGKAAEAKLAGTVETHTTQPSSIPE